MAKTILIGVLVFFMCNVRAQENKKFSTAEIGIVEIYGAGGLSVEQVKSVLKQHDVFTVKQLENELLQMNKAAQVNITTVCCELGKRMLYVGVANDAKAALKWKPLNGKSYRLEDRFIKKHHEFLDALSAAVAKGDNQEDFVDGHSFFHNTAVREMQREFITLANSGFKSLKLVLFHSALPTQRKIAADLIAYANNKQAVSRILVKAMRDPDPEVRNNVIRAIAPLASYQTTHPDIKLKIDYKLLVKMLGSIHWSDRDKVMFVLAAITQSREEKLLALLKKEGMPALIEMANWKSRGHALMAYMILGRVLGVSEDEIFQTWSQNAPDSLLNMASNVVAGKD